MGEAITMTAEGLKVPHNPILPFIEGDGIGPDIWAASVRVLDAAQHWLDVLPVGSQEDVRTA